MIIQKSILGGLLLFLIFSNLSAQNNAISKIDTADMRKHLTYLASDGLQGRRLGTPVDGLDIAADYIVEQVKKIGLKPGVPGYFQPVPLILVKPDKTSMLGIVNSKGKTIYETSDLVRIHGNSGDDLIKEAPVVFAGFGNEIGQVDLKGKIVVIAQGNAKSYSEIGSTAWKNREESVKARALEDQQPLAILFITNPNDKYQRTFNEISKWFDRENYRQPTTDENNAIPTIVALPGFADNLLGGKGKYRKYLEKIVREDNQPVLPVEDLRVNLNWKTIQQKVEAKNMVAYIEGSDPVLKEECVVFMAHYDHIGMDGNGDVFNGADDNGSGTVTIMEVAKAFKALDPKPRRSIVFLWVTCEEIGMFGSSYYTDHPVFPLDKTVACFNLDMVGRVYEPADSVWNKSPKKVKDFNGLFTLSNDVWPGLAAINAEKCRELGLIPDTGLPPNFLRSSDHYSFHKRGVPILNYATGYHADYHQVGDEVEKINFSKMERVAKLCFLVGLEVANTEKIGKNPNQQ